MASQRRSVGSVIEAQLRKIDVERGWSHRYRIRLTLPDGRKIRDPRDFRDKVSANAALAAMKTQIAEGTYIGIADGQTPFRTVYQRWYGAQVSLWSVTRADVVASAWRTWVRPVFGDRPVGAIRHSDVQQFVGDIASQRSAATVTVALTIVRGVVVAAARDRLIASAAAVENIKTPRQSRAKTGTDRHYLTMQQLYTVANNAGRYRTFVLLLGLTGLRFGEASALTPNDISLLEGRVHIHRDIVRTDSQGYLIQNNPKTHAAVRDVTISTTLIDLLGKEMAGKGDDDLIFTAPRGGFMKRVKSRQYGWTDKDSGKPKVTESWWSAALRKSGLDPMPIHDLRHTAASLAVSAGANVKVLQRMLGHASAAMTLDVYADLLPQDADAVADRLDDELSALITTSA